MTFEEFVVKYNIHLNEQQLTAVKSVDKSTLLLAVPGSGKTTVLVTRLGYMIYCCGIPPQNILTVTYTVAATKDMANRFSSVFGSEMASRLEFRTINGICAKIINYFGKCLNKNAFELVTDEGYKTKLLSSIYVNKFNEYPTESDLKAVSTLITYVKNMMLSKKEIEDLGEKQNIPLWEIYNTYCSYMRQNSQMDYDDQMVYALNMLKKSPDLLEHFQDIYRFICVDEAQDTSKIQHEIISLLSKKYDNLFMVGDEDQSIYGFRAAYPEALLDFEKNYKKSCVLLMEENFRSNSKIVEAADCFIQKNKFRHKKNMRAARDSGADIQIIDITSRRKQYTYLLKVAEGCQKKTAVLFRDNESILPVIDLLERNNIAYTYRNSDLTFFTHRIVYDIKDIVAFAQNPMNTELFMKIYYKIGTYINKTAAMQACRECEDRGIDVIDAALNYGNIPAGTKKSIKSMQTHMRGLLNETASKAIYRIINFMGYKDYLERCSIKDGKLQIIEALAVNETSVVSLVERLDQLAQLIREKRYDRDCNFILSTIHSSKGLEYDTVYLMDVKNGIFPENIPKSTSLSSNNDIKEYEEERRLFYVGVTRAKDNLSIFRFNDESIFVDELMGIVKKKIQKSRYNPKKSTSRVTVEKRIVTESEYCQKYSEIMECAHICHKIYGDGRVLSIKGDTLEIEFPNKAGKFKLKSMMENGMV